LNNSAKKKKRLLKKNYMWAGLLTSSEAHAEATFGLKFKGVKH